MKKGFTLIWSFRNRPGILIDSILSAHRTCPIEVDFCLVDMASDVETLMRLRSTANSLSGERKIRICESSYRSSVAEAWNLGMMLTDNRYVIFANPDTLFIRDGWYDVFRDHMVTYGQEYLVMENRVLFAFDKKIIPRIGWFYDNSLSETDFNKVLFEYDVKFGHIFNKNFYTSISKKDMLEQPTDVDKVERSELEIDAHPLYTNKYREEE